MRFAAADLPSEECELALGSVTGRAQHDAEPSNPEKNTISSCRCLEHQNTEEVKSDKTVIVNMLFDVKGSQW